MNNLDVYFFFTSRNINVSFSIIVQHFLVCSDSSVPRGDISVLAGVIEGYGIRTVLGSTAAGE